MDQETKEKAFSLFFSSKGAEGTGLGLFIANIRRSQEAMRVLEEMSKLERRALSGRFKKMRFELYSLEKTVIGKLK